MKKQKAIVYQEDLFIGQTQNTILHSKSGKVVSECTTKWKGAAEGKEQQVIQAKEQKRALTENLITVLIQPDIKL